jgi:hypothetical protein
MSTMPPSGPGIPGGNYPPPGPPYQGPPYQGGYPAGAAPQPGMPQPRKGLGPLAWILIILGSLFLLFVIGISAVVLFVGHKIHQAGKNPAIAIARLAVAANPDVEIVSEDDDRGTLTIHNHKTGKTVTVNAGDIKDGKLSITGDNNETLTFGTSGNGSTGGLDMKTNDGSVHIGAGPVKLPSWLPAYPGATIEGNASSQNAQGSGAIFGFKTSDAPDKIVSFYKDAFASAGLKESANLNTSAMTMIAAADSANKRECSVMISPENGQNAVRVTFADKN